MLTKQDIQRIAEYIKRLSVRDTDFKKTSVVDSDTCVPVIQNNKNRLAVMTVLAAYIISNIDAAALPLVIEGLKNKTLSGILNELRILANTPRNQNNDPIMASDIFYTTVESEEDDGGEGGETLPLTISVAQALNYLYQTVADLENKDNGTGLTEEQLMLLAKLDTNYNTIITAVGDFNSNKPGYVEQQWVKNTIDDAITEFKKNFKVKTLNIENSLDSDNDAMALGADQGKILKQAIIALSNSIANIAYKNKMPYTGYSNWAITDGVSVAITNNSSNIVYIRDEQGNEVSDSSITTVSTGTIKLYVTPRLTNTFLHQKVTYTTSTGDSGEVIIDKSNKRKAVITLTNITSDFTIYITSAVRDAVRYNVTFPDNNSGIGRYISFSETYPDRIIEGSTFETVATFDSLPSTYTITSFELKMSNDIKPIPVDPDATSCTLRWEDVDNAIVVSVVATNTSVQHLVTYENDPNNYGPYTKSNNNTYVDDGEPYQCVLTAGKVGRIQYTFSSVVVTQPSNPTFVPELSNGAKTCTIDIDEVSEDITMRVAMSSYSINEYIVQLTSSATASGLSFTQQTVEEGGMVEGDIIVSDPENYDVPSTVSLVSRSNSPLVSGTDYDNFSYNVINGKGHIIIGNVNANVYISGSAVQKENDTAERRKIVLKLMNVTYNDESDNEYSDTITPNSPLDNPFGYPTTNADISDGYVISLACSNNDYVMNGDVRVNIGGVIVFSQITADENDGVYSEHDITFNASNGNLTIPESVFSEYQGKVNIIATARTGFVTVKAKSKITTIQINGSALSWSDSVDSDGCYTGLNSSEIDSITSIQNGSANNLRQLLDLVSVDFGGIPIELSSLQYLFLGCTYLTEVTGMVVTSTVTSLNRLFEDCNLLSRIDGMYSWDVSMVTNIANMFLHINTSSNTDLSSIDLEDWETTSVSNMQMGLSSSKIFYVYLGNFDTSALAGSGASIPEWLFQNRKRPVVAEVYIYFMSVTPPDISTEYNWLTKNASHIAQKGIYVPSGSAYRDTDGWKEIDKYTEY